MAEVMSKFNDVKSLQELSKVLAWPKQMVAYF